MKTFIKIWIKKYVEVQKSGIEARLDIYLVYTLKLIIDVTLIYLAQIGDETIFGVCYFVS